MTGKFVVTEDIQEQALALDRIFKQSAEVWEKMRELFPDGELECKMGLLVFRYTGDNALNVLVDAINRLEHIKDVYHFQVNATENSASIEMFPIQSKLGIKHI